MSTLAGPLKGTLRHLSGFLPEIEVSVSGFNVPSAIEDYESNPPKIRFQEINLGFPDAVRGPIVLLFVTILLNHKRSSSGHYGRP